MDTQTSNYPPSTTSAERVENTRNRTPKYTKNTNSLGGNMGKTPQISPRTKKTHKKKSKKSKHTYTWTWQPRKTKLRKNNFPKMGKYPDANQMAEQERYDHVNMHLTTHWNLNRTRTGNRTTQAPHMRKRIHNAKSPQSPPSNTTTVQNAVDKR